MNDFVCDGWKKPNTNFITTTENNDNKKVIWMQMFSWKSKQKTLTNKKKCKLLFDNSSGYSFTQKQRKIKWLKIQWMNEEKLD